MKAHGGERHNSLLMTSAARRILGALVLIVLLWLAVAWALTEPVR